MVPVNTSKNTSIWSKNVQKINSVKEMAKSRFFWLPLIAFVAIYYLFSETFYGISGVSILSNAKYMPLIATFDLNIFKIAIGISLVFIFLEMLQGRGRNAGGWICLLATFIVAIDGEIPVIFDNIQFELPYKALYSILLLSWWYVLVFYGHTEKVSLSKIFKAYFWMTIFIAGSSFMMIFNMDMSNQSASFIEMLRVNEFSLSFLLGISLMLMAVTFLWKDICIGEGSTSIICYIVFSFSFILAAILPLYSIWAYGILDRQAPTKLDTLLTLESTYLFACLWLVLLFNSVYNYFSKEYEQKKGYLFLLSRHFPKDALKKLFQAPVWLYMMALLFSTMFLGIRGFTVSREVGQNFISTTFDLNFFIIVVGFIFTFMLLGMLQGRERRVGGWACVCMAFFSPINGTNPIVINEIIFNLPYKVMYSLLFLSCGFILLFYSYIKDVPLSKVLKAYLGVMLLLSGLCLFQMFNVYASSRSMSFIDMFGRNELNALFSLGLILLLSTITFLWKDILNGEGSAKLLSDILFAGLFLSALVISICSIWGYISLLKSAQFPDVTQFSLEWTVFCGGIWILLLFRSMHKYRVTQLTAKEDFLLFLSGKLPGKTLSRLIQAPTWFFLLALPIFVYHFYNTSILFE